MRLWTRTSKDLSNESLLMLGWHLGEGRGKDVRTEGGVGVKTPPWAWKFTKTLLPAQKKLIVFTYCLLCHWMNPPHENLLRTPLGKGGSCRLLWTANRSSKDQDRIHTKVRSGNSKNPVKTFVRFLVLCFCFWGFNQVKENSVINPEIN